LVNIASLYQDEKNYLKAEECLKRAIQIREDGISPDHPGIINSLLNLAILRIVRGNYPSAISLFKRILLLQENYIDMVFTFAGEEQKLEFIDHMSTAYLITLSALYNFMLREDPKMIALGFETVLQRKGIVLDSEARSNKVFHHKMKGELKDTWDERSEKLSRLAQLLLVTTAAEGNKTVETDPADRKDKIKRLQKEIEELERSLKKEAALELPAQPKVTLREITNALPDGSALLEFVKIKDYNFSNSKTPWGITRYIVFIVRKNGDVRMVDLGNSELIDAYIEESLQLIRWEKNDIEKLRESLYHLSSNIWNELEYYLDGIKRLIICPDGLLNLVPFAALIDKNLKYLVERFTISYVTNSREIVQTPRKIIDRDYQLVLVADPDFNYQGVNSTSPGNKIQSREPSFPMKFKRLKGTKRESELIPPLVPVQDFLKKIVTGKEATKETVLSVVDPGILHLATHGFFNNENLSAITSKPLTFGEMMSEQINDLTNMANPKQPAKKPTTSKRSRALTHSGLALAGANRADLESGNANGLLTGLEVTGMQLSGTDLVVLSACDTGFSEFMSGEGVFGLRRAFAIAGARNLVMSLWPVNDECTTEQMGMFYRNLQRMPPAEALRQAQLQTMEKDVRGILPVIWAPFIIQGGQAQTALIYGPPRE
jgi:CHAT domain-containing protein